MSETQEEEGKRIVQALVEEIDARTSPRVGHRSVRCEIGPRDFDSGVYPVTVTNENRETTLWVSREDIEDLPATPEIKEEMKQRLQYAIAGIRERLSKEYVTKNGPAFRLIPSVPPGGGWHPVATTSFQPDPAAAESWDGTEAAFAAALAKTVFEFPFKIEEIEGKSRATSGLVTLSRFIRLTLLSDSRQALRVCINRLRTALDRRRTRRLSP